MEFALVGGSMNAAQSKAGVVGKKQYAIFVHEHKNKMRNHSLGCLSKNTWNLLRSYSTDCCTR